MQPWLQSDSQRLPPRLESLFTYSLYSGAWYSSARRLCIALMTMARSLIAIFHPRHGVGSARIGLVHFIWGSFDGVPFGLHFAVSALDGLPFVQLFTFYISSGTPGVCNARFHA